MKATQVCVDRCTEKQSEVHPHMDHTWTLRRKREGHSDTHCHVEKSARVGEAGGATTARGPSRGHGVCQLLPDRARALPWCGTRCSDRVTTGQS